MLYREMKKSGDRLSILGFGCMRLPQRKGTPSRQVKTFKWRIVKF